MKPTPINIKNKRASFDYEFIDTYTAGIVLTGTEIKSIRLGKASLVDTYCYFVQGELWVKNMHIAEYFYGSYNNHSARRERKLLLNKKELRKLEEDGEIFPFLNAAYSLVDASVKRYMERGFSNLSVCFGCTGGQHRSVYSAQHMAEHINKKFGVKVELIHREQNIEQTFERTL